MSTMTQQTIEVFDNEDGSFYSLCPLCGASALAWDARGAAHEILSHIEEEHDIEYMGEG